MVHFLWKVGDWFCKMEKVPALFARHDLFFLLDSQVIRIFRLKNCLIILSAVTYVISGWMCFRAARYQSGNYWLVIFLETTVNYERMCPGNKSHRPSPWSDSPRVKIRVVVRIRVRGYLGLGCMKGYLGLKLGSGLWALICLCLLNRNAGLKAMIPTKRTRIYIIEYYNIKCKVNKCKKKQKHTYIRK